MCNVCVDIDMKQIGPNYAYNEPLGNER